jgi:hypothetical protein
MEADKQKREYPVDPLAFNRFEKCKQCKRFVAAEDKCSLCGCNIRAVVNDDQAECPIGKW